jgi:NAD(P)-dependent dehydrogenase (short-subunit alcohol dehydrogenase family)
MLDITKGKDINGAVVRIGEQVGESGLQGLVNNAGIAVAGPLEFLPIDELRRQIEVNLIAQVAVTQAFLPQLRTGRGRIVNMSSISGRVAAPLVGPYAISKFALEAFSDSLRRELHFWNLHVAVIEPGAIKSPIWKKSLRWADGMLTRLPARAEALYGPMMRRTYDRLRITGSRGIQADGVARATYHALSAYRPRTRYIVGRGTRIAIWLARWLPDEIVDQFLSRMFVR